MSVSQQCALLGLSRSSYYYEPATESADNLALMALLDREYTAHPFLGSRGLAAYLRRRPGGQSQTGAAADALMGLEAVYPKPRLSVGGAGHKVYPYLLRNVAIERVNQVWSTDITYIPMPSGFMYLTAVIDWYSRYVLSWRLSNTLDVAFLCGGLGRGLEPRLPGGIQHRPGSAVHVGVVYRTAGSGGGQGEHGWQGPLSGQRVRGTTVAHGEVRVRVPMASGGGAHAGWGLDELLQVLQRGQAASGPGVSSAGGGLRYERQPGGVSVGSRQEKHSFSPRRTSANVKVLRGKKEC